MFTQTRFVLSIEGVDETTIQTIRARHIYAPDSIRLNHRYRDISSFDDGRLSIMDFSLFDEIVKENSRSREGSAIF